MTEDFDPQVLFDAIAGVGERLDEHEEAIGRIIDLLTNQPGGPWRWDKLQPAARERLWNDLFEFVTWLDARYLSKVSREAYPLQPCWYQHEVAVEALTALMVAYLSVYRKSATVASFGLVDWHERCLWPTFERMKRLAMFKNCSASKHEADAGESLRIDRAAFDEFIATPAAADMEEEPGHVVDADPTPPVVQS